MAARPKKNPWLAAEVRELTRLHGSVAVADLALLLKRPEAEIVAQAAKLELGQTPRRTRIKAVPSAPTADAVSPSATTFEPCPRFGPLRIDPQTRPRFAGTLHVPRLGTQDLIAVRVGPTD